MVSPGFLQTNATLVTQKINLPGMVEDILQLQPQTTNIVVVFGASALERFWAERVPARVSGLHEPGGVHLGQRLNAGSDPETLRRAAATLVHPARVVHRGRAGVPCENNEALRRLHEVANAPVFGYFTSEFGLGSIGGRLFQDTEVGAQAARTAVRILRGESAGAHPAADLRGDRRRSSIGANSDAGASARPACRPAASSSFASRASGSITAGWSSARSCFASFKPL